MYCSNLPCALSGAEVEVRSGTDPTDRPGGRAQI